MSEIAKRIIEEVLTMTGKLPKEDEGLQEAMSDVEQAVDELIAAALAEKDREIENYKQFFDMFPLALETRCKRAEATLAEKDREIERWKKRAEKLEDILAFVMFSLENHAPNDPIYLKARAALEVRDERKANRGPS